MQLHYADLERLLQRVDEDLRREGVPIPFRPLRAIGEVARELDQNIASDSAVALNVGEWFSRRYRERLFGPTLMGRVAMEVSGDVHVLRLAPKLERISHRANQVRPSFDWEIDAGPEFLEMLPAIERTRIRDLLSMGFRAYSELASHLCERVLSESATIDLDTSIDELVRPQGPRLGLSRWASLQMVEKSLKDFIRRMGGSPPRSHDLRRLHALATTQGCPDLDSFALPEGRLLDLVMCSPGVRYGEVVPTVAETVVAHHAALLIASGIAMKLRAVFGGRSWIDEKNFSPALFVLKRICEMGGIEHVIEVDR